MKKQLVTALDGISLENAVNDQTAIHRHMLAYVKAGESLNDLREIVAANPDAGVSMESSGLLADTFATILNDVGIQLTSFDGKVTLESIDVALENISMGFGKDWAKYKANWVRAFHPLWSMAKITMMRMSSLAVNASKSENKGGHQVTIPAKYLGKDGNHDLLSYYTRVVKTLDELIEKFPDHAVECFIHNRKLAVDMNIRNEVSWEAAASKVFSGWHDARSMFSKEELEQVYPNGSRLFINEPTRYTGSDPVAKKFDDLAFKHYPTMSGSTSASETGHGSIKVKALSPEEVRSLAGKFRNALSRISLLESIMNKAFGELSALFTTGVVNPSAPISFLLGKSPVNKLMGEKKAEVNTIFHAVQTAYELFAAMPFDAGRVLNQSSTVFIKVAKICLKEHTVSNESISNDKSTGMGDGINDGTADGAGETVSLEGGFKLRAGMRVRYSRGYGKIVKIFDRPTKYKGEIHHCSKDNPKYEVKSDVGNKLSLHKASALTPL